MLSPLRNRFLAVSALSATLAFEAWWGLSAQGPEPAAGADRSFAEQVRPFFEKYCVACHGAKKPKSDLDLTAFASFQSIASHGRTLETILERLHAKEMPPASAPRQPQPAERAAVMNSLRALRDQEAERHAGDPGVVRARRLSNAEFDYTIHDLTGVDIRPAREFPVDPANEAGFDNSGESLAMSPGLLKKYLASARLVAEHVVLRPDGFVFAPHPVVTPTDRDKYCVQRILDFYERHKVDLADYLVAARRLKGEPGTDLNKIAAEAQLSARYLKLLAEALNDPKESIGPLAVVQRLWSKLPPDASAAKVRQECAQLRDLVLRWRGQLKPKIDKLGVNGISPGSQTMVLWANRARAGKYRSYTGTVASDVKKLAELLQSGDAELTKLLPSELKASETETRLRQALDRFCSVFPYMFVVVDRGPYFSPNDANKGRPLTAGFHLMQGYFRDDEPLCDLILNDAERRKLDGLWRELDFITLAPMRQYQDFIFFERAEPPRFMFEAEFDFARSEDKDVYTLAKMDRLEKLYLAKARKNGASETAVQAIEDYFAGMARQIRAVEQGRLQAEASHLRDLVAFAERAYRRPLEKSEADELRAFYRKLRKQDDLDHEEALRDALASVLLAPQFCYRLDLPAPGTQAPAKTNSFAVEPLSDIALASRLSYFLWSSMPDEELLKTARAGDLHRPAVLKAQARRMLHDPRARRFATEFLGNWLDIRRFEEHNAVDRERFRLFTNELRQAMFEEPIRYFTDVVQQDRSILDLLYGHDTFVNPVLAKHYGMPVAAPTAAQAQRDADKSQASAPWIHVADADRYGRGGLLPMAVFLTKNAPGLRTSPVKRGYWVVRRLLGETIPPPPPEVPELPKDEAKLGDLTLAQTLARHRNDKGCAGCHRRFDAVGLVFEGFGPIGERRTNDLGGRAVEITATFPDGVDRAGLEGLRAYLHDQREADFTDNLCKKLLTYALGRSLLLSDKKTLDEMRGRLKTDGHRFSGLVETIVTSPQFLKRRAQEP